MVVRAQARLAAASFVLTAFSMIVLHVLLK
jgi:hypothetical protein